jgi:PadR family transcriptional regulator, regulatory protein PadR
MDKSFRITLPLLRVLKVMYSDMEGEHYGLSLSRATGLSNGTLYPILDRLEDAGLITGDWEAQPSGRRRRFFYRLTGEGIRVFETHRAELFGGTLNYA